MNFFRKNKHLTVVTIHGFGTKASREMTPLSDYLRKQGYHVVQFDIFDPADESDTETEKWIERCEDRLRSELKKKDPVVLLGFSMGGVIASYLASVFPVKALILVAPAFEYFDFSKLQKAGLSLLSAGSGSSKDSSMTMDQNKAFMRIISTYKNSIAHVDCPVLILHGTEDEVIQPRSSHAAFGLIPHEQKRLVFIEGGKHRMLYDGKVEKLCFALIRDMLSDDLM